MKRPANTPYTVAPVANPRGGSGTRVARPPQPQSTPATQPHQRSHDHNRSNPMHPCTVRPAEGPFRRTLLPSTVSNTPDAHRWPAKVDSAGGGPSDAHHRARRTEHAIPGWLGFAPRYPPYSSRIHDGGDTHP